MGIDPGGITEISRWLSEAIPPVRCRTDVLDPGGVAEARILSSPISGIYELGGLRFLRPLVCSIQSVPLRTDVAAAFRGRFCGLAQSYF